MCGIAGFVARGARRTAPENVEVLGRMCDVIRHRGPDDHGMWSNGLVSLGMRRLAIIDLGGGRQPMTNEDGRVLVVFNGEIYNYRDLVPELESKGHRFRTRSDTEVIVHAWEEYGPSCLHRFRGMFAFAIWDANTETLFLARDRVGKKPLYYALTNDQTLVFGSELKSLLAYPSVTREVDPVALDTYLTLGYVPDPLSIFAGVQKLAPGCCLQFADGGVLVSRYWDFEFDATDNRSEEEIAADLRDRLDEAVRVRLIADVPLGALLSGGIDSTAIVALMSRHMSQPVKTFSIGFHEASHDELKYARIAAQRYETEHHEFVVTPDICSIVDDLVWHFDEPFADASAIPTYMVSKLARAHVTVALSGDGGDELFAGYTRYAVDRRRSAYGYVPGVLRQGIVKPIARLLPHGALGRNYLYNIALPPLERYLDSISVFTSLQRASLYTGDFRASLGTDTSVSRTFQEYAARVNTNDPLDTLLYIDSKTYLPGDILTKVDRMSMAVSLEARAPLLDHCLIEDVVRIPSRLKMRGLETKHILRRAVRDLVPEEILNRPKQGFGMPLHRWMNDELRDRFVDTLTDSRTSARGYLEPRYVQTLLDEHRRNRRDHNGRIWSLFMLELWLRQFVDEAPGRADGHCSVILAEPALARGRNGTVPQALAARPG